MEKYTIESFNQQISNMYPEQFDLSQTVFVDTKNIATLFCKTHGAISKPAYVFLDKSRVPCSLCKKEINSSTKVYWDSETFKYQLEKIYPNNFDYSDYTYTKIKSPITLKCLKCNTTSTKSAAAFLANGCSYCKKQNNFSVPIKLTEQNVISRINEIYKGKLGYIAGSFTKINEPMSCICLDCNLTLTKNATVFFQGYGCPLCKKASGIRSAARYDQDMYLHYLSTLPNINNIDFTKVQYKDIETHIELICPAHGSFFRSPCNISQIGINCPKCSPVSKPEEEIKQFIAELGVELEKTPDFIKPFKLDAYIPSCSLAIEYNGFMYHHSSRSEFISSYAKKMYKDPLYHFNKWKICFDNKVNLLSIYDFYWTNPIKQEIYKSKIRHYLNLDTVIYARKCKIIKINNDIAYDFYEANHLEGSGIRYSNATSYALVYDDTIYMCATVYEKYNQATKTFDLKLQRICTLLNYTIAGGLSKISKFIKNNHGSFIYQITLATGGSSLGAAKSYRIITPRYFWVKSLNNYYHRNYCQKHLLQKHFKEPLLQDDTESTYMERLGYLKVYDNGLAEIQI